MSTRTTDTLTVTVTRQTITEHHSSGSFRAAPSVADMGEALARTDVAARKASGEFPSVAKCGTLVPAKGRKTVAR